MSSYRGDHYFPPSRQHGSYDRPAYQQRFADAPAQAPSNSLDPLDPLSNVQRPKGYPQRDNGWGNRRPGADSQAAPSRAAETYQRAETWTSDPRTLPPPPGRRWDSCTRAPEALPPHRPPMTDPRRPRTPPQQYGWAAQSTPATNHGVPANRQSNGRGFASAEEQQVSCFAPAPASSPGSNARPATTDPRRPSASSSHDWEPEAASTVAMPPQYPVVSKEEIKLEYLLRMIEERLNKQLNVPAPEWERVDTQLLAQLVDEHRNLKSLNTMRSRTMHTSMAHYCVMIDCMAANRAHPTAQEKLVDIRNGVQNIVFDICEDESVGIRKQGHRALLELSSRDITLHRSNFTALVELMQNHDDDERALVRESILKHFQLAKQSDYPDVNLISCFELMFGDKAELRGLVVDFFASDWGQRVVEMIVGEPVHEAALSKHLANTLPLATKFGLPKVVSLLHDLQSIWVGPDDVLSESDQEAAREAVVAVLWNLGWALMAKHNLCVLPSSCKSEEGRDETRLLPSTLNEMLAKWKQTAPRHLVTDGLKTCSSLVDIVERTMLGRGEEMKLAAAQKLSEAKLFLNELEASTTYLFCYLSLEDGAIEEPGAVVHHFSATQKIVLFRSAANLAARVASAAKQCPPELAFAGDNTASDISKIMARALMAHVPINGVSYVRIGEEDRSPDVTRARKAYKLLATEALLTALDQCSSCIRTIGRPPWIDGHFQDRVRDIIGLAREVQERELYPEEVRESAGSVVRLGQRCIRATSRSDAEQPTPTWLIPPPPFPQWVNPLKAQEQATLPDADLGKGKRRADSQDTRRVRGRGAVHAFHEDSWDADVKTEHTTGGPASPMKKGIAFVGPHRRSQDVQRTRSAVDVSVSKQDG